MKTHCKRGHEFDIANTYIQPKTGGRACKKCMAAQKVQWAKDNPEKIKSNAPNIRAARKRWRDKNPDYHRSVHLIRKYGITLEHYNKIMEEQNGCCAICEQRMYSPQVDHDHESGKVRNLLCVGCNTGIGSFRESTLFLEKAITYLKKHKGLNEQPIT